MSYRWLHPTHSVTYTSESVANDLIPGAAATIATISGGIEDLSEDEQRAAIGRVHDVALKHWIADTATVLDPTPSARVLGALTYRGRARSLEVARIIGPFGSAKNDHREIILVSRVTASRPDGGRG